MNKPKRTKRAVRFVIQVKRYYQPDNQPLGNHYRLSLTDDTQTIALGQFVGNDGEEVRAFIAFLKRVNKFTKTEIEELISAKEKISKPTYTVELSDLTLEEVQILKEMFDS